MKKQPYRYVFHPAESGLDSVWRIFTPDLPLGDHTFEGWIPEHLIRAITDHLNGYGCRICREDEDMMDNDPQESPPSEIGGRPEDLYERYLGPSYRSGHYADE